MNRNTFARLAVLLLAAVSLALSGCGGDDGVDQSVHDMVTAERDANATALAAAQAAADMAATQAAQALAAAQQAQADALTAQTAAEAARDEARMGEANAVTRADAADKAAADAAAAAKTASDAAAAAAADLKTAQDALAAAMTGQMEAEEDLDMAQEMVSELESTAMNAENVARASTLHTALDVINETGTNNTLDTDAADGLQPETVVDRIDLADSPAMDGQPLSDVSPGSVDGHADAPAALAFTYTEADGASILGLAAQGYTAGGEAPAIDGWNGLVMQRRDGGDNADQVLYAYSNIGIEGETFYQKYGAGLTENKLTVNNANLALAASGSFPGATDPAVVFPSEADTAGVQAVSFAGTFDGVAGTFSCAAEMDGCTVTASATGTLSVVGNLAFTPTDGNTVIAPVSSDYLYFGYWLHKPDDAGSAHGFSVVSGGSDPFMVRRAADNPRTAATETSYSIVHTLAGTARYSGPAAGKWVTRDLENNTAAIGVFTATAAFTADFDADSAWMMAAIESDGDLAAAPASDTISNAGMVSGAISGFMDMDGNELDWHVTLANASLAAIGQPSARMAAATATASAEVQALLANDRTVAGQSTSRFMGTASARIGAAATATGDWTGTFFGNDRVDGHPGAIAGNFDISSTHTSIGGSFGASNND